MEFDNGLEALLQRSEELTADLHGGADLPRVRRNLGQVLDAGKRLWAKTAAHGTDSHQVKVRVQNPPFAFFELTFHKFEYYIHG